MPEYELVRSARKTLALYVRRDGRVEVRAPLRTSKAYIDDFVRKKQDWIENTQAKQAARQEAQRIIRLTPKEELQYRKQAKECLQQKCGQFALLMGLCPGEVRINGAKTRWGSCNRKGDINFTYRLLFAPEKLIDYVVVHELAHLKEMNHSDRFWAIVEAALPDYRERRKRLREFERQVEVVVIPE
ncbi:MAG TPA: SprT family zinc-dependent metalloprotease [Bacillota bacterium]|nr:SprT family zinc-dependent metalloprotease [Bacillota bacterium]